MTEAALNHRFRRLRAEALIISEGRKQGFDMKDLCMSDDLPRIQGGVDKNSMLVLLPGSLPMPPSLLGPLPSITPPRSAAIFVTARC